MSAAMPSARMSRDSAIATRSPGSSGSPAAARSSNASTPVIAIRLSPLSYGGHALGNLLGERQRPSSILARDLGRPPIAHRVHEVPQLTLQRFFVRHRDDAAFDGG